VKKERRQTLFSRIARIRMIVHQARSSTAAQTSQLKHHKQSPPLLGPIPTTSAPVSFPNFLAFPPLPFLILSFPFSCCQETRRSQECCKLPQWAQCGAPATKAFLVYSGLKKCVSNSKLFWRSKCSSKVSEPKEATVQTILCERTD